MVCAPDRTELDRAVTTERVRKASALRFPRELWPHFDIAIASVACWGGVRLEALDLSARSPSRIVIELNS